MISICKQNKKVVRKCSYPAAKNGFYKRYNDRFYIQSSKYS